MEPLSFVKSVVTVASQYYRDPRDENLTYLLRQLDILVSITKKGSSLTFFDLKQPQTSECLISLVDILCNINAKIDLVSKTLTLLNNLGNSDAVSTCLHARYGLTAVLTKLLPTFPVDSAAAEQCIRLVQKITYNFSVTSKDTYIEQLVQYLIVQIEGKETRLTKFYLGAMGNICRSCQHAQYYIKNCLNLRFTEESYKKDALESMYLWCVHEGNLRAFYKKTLSYLVHQGEKEKIFALSILVSLCFSSSPESNYSSTEFFTPRNTMHCFGLLFNTIATAETNSSRFYAVDVFKYLLSFEKIQQQLGSYTKIQSNLQQVFAMLNSSDAAASAKLLELLASFCCDSSVRSTIAQILFTRREQYVDKDGPLSIVLHWASIGIEVHKCVHVRALELLLIIYQDSMTKNEQLVVDSIIEPTMLMLIPTILSNTSNSDLLTDTSHLALKKKAAVRLLICLLGNSAIHSTVTSAIDLNVWTTMIESERDVLVLHGGGFLNAGNIATPSQDCIIARVELILFTMNLMLILGASVLEYSLSLRHLLEDRQLVQFMAYGIHSSSPELVKVSLKLLSTLTADQQSLSIEFLSEHLCAFNKQNLASSDGASVILGSSRLTESESRVSVSSGISSLNFSGQSLSGTLNGGVLRVPSSINGADCKLDTRVRDIIERVQNDLELKTLLPSELITLYERRLQAVQANSEHLEEALEARNVALAQSDRLLLQYRSRLAQFESEDCVVRTMLLSCEQRFEDLQERYQMTTRQLEHALSKIDEFTTANRELEVIAADYQKLLTTYKEQSQTLESVRSSLAQLKDDHQTLIKVNDECKAQLNTARLENDNLKQQLVQLGQEKLRLEGSLTTKERELEDLEQDLEQKIAELIKVQKDHDTLEAAIDKLRLQLTAIELSKKDLQLQVSSLEIVCRQHETAIKEKDILIGQQRDELNKHSQIAQLIHNLSGGKAVPTTGVLPQ